LDRDEKLSNMGLAMRHETYTFVFEKFPDGSSLLRAFEFGRPAGEQKMQELAGRSVNEFFAIDIQIDAPSTELATNTGAENTALGGDLESFLPRS
jgi:hypothetical protein